MTYQLLVLPIYALFTMNGTSNLPAYQYNAKLESQNQLVISVCTTSFDNLTAVIDFKYETQLYYNDTNSFYLDQHEFTFNTKIYINDNTTPLYNWNDYKYTEIAITNTNFSDNFNFRLDFEWINNQFNIGLDTSNEMIWQESHNTVLGQIITNSQKNYQYYLYGIDTLLPQINQYINTTIGDGSYYQGTLDGYNNGYENGYNDGKGIGYQDGYADGYTLGSSQDETATAIFVGIINVALVPINFFLAMLNFEVFGINIGSMVSALLTIAIIVIIIRTIIGGGNKSD